MLRLVKIGAALGALLFGFIWLLTQVTSGWSAPGWVPAACGFSAGVYCVIDVFTGG